MSLWPGINEWVFAVKTFAAAMLALYIAMSIGLDRPYWAMATVYIVSQPLTGSVRSKALYRVIGTLIGATAMVAMVPNLVDTPELLSIALALWTGLCLYLALLDRSPRSYVFMLAGYTVALIGFPAVTTPGAVWDIAVARVEEICLGVICSTVIGSVVFPRALGPLLSSRILAWVGDAAAWADEVLAGDEAAGGGGAPGRLAANAVELRMLSSQLAFDTSRLQGVAHWVTELQRRMVLLLPLLSSIGDRLTALRAAGGVAPPLEELLADLRVWMGTGIPPPPRSEADRLRAAIARLEADADPRAGWNEIMRGSLLLRLRQLVDVRQDMRDLRQHIERGGGALASPLAVPTHGRDLLHRDHGLALLSAFAATLTIVVLCGFLVATGWQAGVSAVGLAAAACSLFASFDDPTPMLERFMLAVLIAVIAVGIGLFGILPLVHDFETLALALAAFFVPVSLLTTLPATQAIGTALGFITATLLSLDSAYAADFVSYADGSLAALLGLAVAAVITALVRSVGAEWSARRLLRAVWRDLAAIPHSQTLQDHNRLAGLLVDRLGLLVPRLAVVGGSNDLACVDVLQDLRVGINMADMQRDRDAMPLAVRAGIDDVLAATAGHFRARVRAGRVLPPSPMLLQSVDRTLLAAADLPGDRARDLLLQLEGIRRGLFAKAPPLAHHVVETAA